MAEFTAINRSDAPRPSRQSGRLAARMREYERYVAELASARGDRAGKLVPGRGETPRGVSLRIKRAGKRLKRPVESWVDDGVVYFTVS